MYIYQVFRANPFAAMAVCFCLVTVWLCMRIIKGKFGPDRFLLAVLGLLSVLQGLRIIVSQNGGMKAVARFQGIADACTAALFLAAVFILRRAIAAHVSTSVQLRLAESEKGNSPSPSVVTNQAWSAGQESPAENLAVLERL